MTILPRVALGLLAFLSLPASAEQWRGVGDTAFVGVEEQREGGALVGCNISFTQVFGDDVHRGGATVIARGLLAMVKPAPRSFGFFLKMVGEDKGGGINRGGALFSPSFAYVSGAGFTSAHRESQVTKCEGPGFCAVYFDDRDMSGLLDLSLSRSFTASYQRRPGALDTSFLVRLATESAPTSPVNDRFAACARNLVAASR